MDEKTAVIIYRTPEGKLIPVPMDQQVAPGWVPVTQTQSLAEANMQIAAMGGATQGHLMDSEMSQNVQPNQRGTDWVNTLSTRAAAKKAADAKAAADQSYSATDAADPFNQSAAQAPAPGGGWSYGQSTAGKEPSARYGNPPVPDLLPSGVPSFKPSSSASTSYTGGSDSGINGQTNNDLPYTSNYGWMTGQPTYSSEQLLDPKFMTDTYLDATGSGNHANRGFMENAVGNYDDLYYMMNPTASLTPSDQAVQSGDFAGGLSNATGGRYVDTRALWDNQFTDSYGQGLGQIYGQSENMGQSQYDQVMKNIDAMQEWMGPRGAAIAQSLVTDAWYEYQRGGMNQGQSFVQYLSSIGADQWF